MSDIFISYAREDQAAARRLAKALEDEGWSIWWDPEIPAGKTFDEVIEQAIGAAKSIVVIWSKHSVNSRWVRTEAAEGADRGILVPVLIEDVRIPLAFKRIQAANLAQWDGAKYHPAFQNLVNDIAVILGPPPAFVKTAEIGTAKQPERSGAQEAAEKQEAEMKHVAAQEVPANTERTSDSEEERVKDKVDANRLRSVTIVDPATQRIALACVIAVLGGFLTPKASAHSLDRALLVWLVFIISAGLILEGIKIARISSAILISVPVAFFYALTLIVYFVITYFGGAATDFSGPTLIMGGIELSGSQLVEKLPFLIVLLAIDFVGSIVLISLAILSGKLVMNGLYRLFELEPDAIDRATKILMGISGLAGALFMLWGAFG